MRKFLLFTFLYLIACPITACSGTFRIEPVAFDADLHGQVINFTIPMAYMELTTNDSGKYPSMEIEIGKLLTSSSKINSLYNTDKKHKVNNIKESMEFTIIESYWIRQDWITRELAPDVQRVILKDEDGILSVALRSVLFDSNKPELGE